MAVSAKKGVAFHDGSITFCYSVVSHLQKGVDLLDGVTFCYSMVLRRRNDHSSPLLGGR